VIDPMIGTNKSITAILAAWAVTATAWAGVIPVSRLDTAGMPPASLCDRADLQQTNICDLSVDWLDTADLDSCLVGSLPKSDADVAQSSETKPLQVFADDQSSLSLCLCVLMGMGLCRSVPFVKKMSIGCIPDWYHTGGPFQVGHSHAIGPDLRLAPVVCFIQPDCATEDSIPEPYRGTIASLVRQSQFAPSQLASRAPPSLHSQSFSA